MNKFFFYILLSFLFASCSKKNVDKISHVNPFVGAAELGHCMPNACSPLGLIQVGPQSGNYTWDYTAGYQYKDSLIYGFSQNRLNGTGCPDLGDLLILPFSGRTLQSDYVSAYDKSTQFAEPGYYAVRLKDYDINTEMTCSEHVAFHRYSFEKKDSTHLLIDFQNGMMPNKESSYTYVIDSDQNFVSSTRIVGYAHTKNWVERTYYFAIDFNRPIVSKQQLPLRNPMEKAPRYVLNFDLLDTKELLVKVSLSSTSIEGAIKNLTTEIPHWEFDVQRKITREKWETLLSRVEVSGTKDQKDIFYTAMYRLFTQPNNIADVDCAPFYSTLSLWDTYRAAHPLYTILSPDYVDAFVNSMLHQYDLQGFLPIWALWGGETYCMIGNHAVPVIVDAYLKGFRGFDVDKAYKAVTSSLNKNLPKSNAEMLDKYGYLPYDLIKNENVSRTLELCYDNYCAAQFAKALSKSDDYHLFSKRSNYYKNLFDPSTGLMRAKDSKGNWRTPFDKLVVSHESTSGGDYTEGNAWQYTWHVQHDVDSLIAMLGGNDRFSIKLDSLFTLQEVVHNDGFSGDVSGLIGQYAHGNEPSHHVAYLYRLAGQPHKTEKLINCICREKYQNKVDGLCGNDDCGQMSAWYIFSAMGFYPVNPCGGQYVFGAPQLPKITLHLTNGKHFTVEAVNYSPDNIFVEKITLNGKQVTRNYITHQEILNGGDLKFYMNKNVK